MLKYVNFILADAAASKEARKMAVRLRKRGLEVKCHAGDEAVDIYWENPGETLFITDIALIAHELLDRGGYAVILYTQENREGDLGGIRYALENLRGTEEDYLFKLYDRCAGIPWNILTTERCRVREITVEDVEELYHIYEDPEITAYMEGLFEDRQQELEYTKAYIRNMYGFYGYGMWIVEELESGAVIGRAGIEYKEEEGLELGYMIAKPFQRKGYAYEVCKAVMRYANEELGFSRITACVEPGNTASVRLCRKLCMTRTGTKEAAGKKLEIFQKDIKQAACLPVL